MARVFCLLVITCFGFGLAARPAAAEQVVLLDFDSGTDHAYVYPVAQRSAIQAGIEAIYADFDFTFVQTAPLAGDYSTVTFNAGGPGGLASNIDTRNLDKNDSAVVNAVAILDLGFAAVTPANIEAMSILIGAHELGHLQGLRHADSIGPIGTGVVTGGLYFNTLSPPYPGPVDVATEVGIHTMGSPASVGQTPAQALGGTYFGERSAIKLEFNESGKVVGESGGNSSMATAQTLDLSRLHVPNTLMPGDANYSDFIGVRALTVESYLDEGTEDWFKFHGSEGELWNIQVLSIANRFQEEDLQLATDFKMALYDSSGALVDYFSTPAVTDDEFEYWFDPFIWDLTLPDTDWYFIKVWGTTGVKVISPPGYGDIRIPTRGYGGYELFAFAVPEPGSITLVLLGLSGVFVRRRRRRDG